MSFADVDDVTLFYTDEGAGNSTILFVHGYSCDSHDWSWQIPHFASQYRVIVLDIRGHGRSSVPAGGYNHLRFAADVAGLLDQINCAPVIAIGHSLGGVIVSTLAIERPDLVSAVVTIDPGYLLPDEIRGSLDPILDALASEDPVGAAQAMMGSTYTPETPASLKTWHMRRLAGNPVHVLRETMTNLLRDIAFASESGPYLGKRQCPVLSFYTDPQRARAEEALFVDQRSRSVCWEGSGHWLHQERYQEVNHVVDTWLASL